MYILHDKWDAEVVWLYTGCCVIDDIRRKVEDAFMRKIVNIFFILF